MGPYKVLPFYKSLLKKINFVALDNGIVCKSKSQNRTFRKWFYLYPNIRRVHYTFQSFKVNQSSPLIYTAIGTMLQNIWSMYTFDTNRQKTKNLNAFLGRWRNDRHIGAVVTYWETLWYICITLQYSVCLFCNQTIKYSIRYGQEPSNCQHLSELLLMSLAKTERLLE